MNKEIPVITIDGPSASGKGTISKRLAQKLQWHYLDSGALYRALAYSLISAQVNTDSDYEIDSHISELSLEYDYSSDDGKDSISVNGVEVQDNIRAEEVGKMASKIASKKGVRDRLTQLQREHRVSPGLVADGRDMGTQIFPDATQKVFLTASVDERAQRRYKQLKQKGIDVNLAKLRKELITRDEQDSNRVNSPLIPANEARILDTSDMDINAVVEDLLSGWNSRCD